MFTKSDLAEARRLIKIELGAQAIGLINAKLSPNDEFYSQNLAAKLIPDLKNSNMNSRTVRIAILASSTLDHFANTLDFWLLVNGIQAEIFIAPFDTINQSILDGGSELYKFKPDVVWIFTTFRDIDLETPPGAPNQEVYAAVDGAVKIQASLWKMVLEKLNCVIFQNNIDIPGINVFGQYAGSVAWGDTNIKRLYNVKLSENLLDGVYIFDIDHLSSLFGKLKWVDNAYWHHSKHPFSFDALGLVCHAAAKLIAATKGLSKKCLVLDLDNTLWGGVIGDDGLEGIRLGNYADGEAYVDFQRYVKKLKSRGIILAVCSKNDESNAKEPFQKHPNMHLKLDDVAVFKANWNNKCDNIREIAQTLNIGLDSLVFADDNPAEREIVRQFLPEVSVPELGKDPANYINEIATERYFECASFAAEDLERAKFYQENAEREKLKLTFSDTSSYLSSLAMSAESGSLDDFHLPRMSQLINKSNQFHLTGTRYSEAELMGLNLNSDIVLRHFKLKDKFGDNGLISVVILKRSGDELLIDTWVMSCRVLSRTMEEFIINEVIEIAQKLNCNSIIGKYIKSPKNKLVENLYPRLGFKLISNERGISTLRLDLPTTTINLTYIDNSNTQMKV